jgi:hypothetical protein
MSRGSSRQRDKVKLALSVLVVGLITSALVAGVLYLIGQTRPHF